MKVEIIDKDHGWNDLARFFRRNGGKTPAAKAGIVGAKGAAMHEDAKHEDGQPMSNADLALVHEFGADRVPERSFIRAAFDANRERYIEQFKTLIGAVYDRKLTLRRALGLLGQQASSDMRNKIRAGIPPPNAEATIARKGSSKPLIDSGQLINSVSYEVDMAGKPDTDGKREA